MKLMTAFKNSFLLLTLVLLNSLTFVGHSAAISTMSHEMNGMSHESGNTTICATLCRTAVLNNESNNPNQSENEEDDDLVMSPLLGLNQAWELSSRLVRQRLYAAEVKPPPKIPIYIAYQVFRV